MMNVRPVYAVATVPHLHWFRPMRAVSGFIQVSIDKAHTDHGSPQFSALMVSVQ